jgi:hypothetical protein
MEFAIKTKKLSLADVDGELDEFWRDLRHEDSSVHANAMKVGIDLNGLPAVRSEALEASASASGFDPATTAIIVAFTPVVAKIASDLWKLFIAGLKRKYGEGVIVDPTAKPKA